MAVAVAVVAAVAVAVAVVAARRRLLPVKEAVRERELLPPQW